MGGSFAGWMLKAAGVTAVVGIGLALAYPAWQWWAYGAAVAACLAAWSLGAVVAAGQAAEPYEKAQVVRAGDTEVRVAFTRVGRGVDAEALGEQVALFVTHALLTGSTPQWAAPASGNSQPRLPRGEPTRLTAAAPSPRAARPVPSDWIPPLFDPTAEVPSRPTADAFMWEAGRCEQTGRFFEETRECLLHGEDGGLEVLRIGRQTLAADDDLYDAVAAAEAEWGEEQQMQRVMARDRSRSLAAAVTTISHPPEPDTESGAEGNQ